MDPATRETGPGIAANSRGETATYPRILAAGNTLDRLGIVEGRRRFPPFRLEANMQQFLPALALFVLTPPLCSATHRGPCAVTEGAEAGILDLRSQEAPAKPAPPELETKLDSIVRDFLESHEVPGLAVGVVREGEVVFARGYGFANLKTKTPITTRSLFHLASVSKTFVATAIVQLAEQGQIDLDKPTVEYLPYFRLDDKRAATITIRQMLSHTSGMPDVHDYGWENPEYDDGALERYVRSLSKQKLRFDPGSRWRYSNMAYEVLGDVVSKVSGMPFETYVAKFILEPLGMVKSTFLRKATDPKLRTTPHVGRHQPKVSEVYPYHRAHAPSSTLHSNVEELCRWIQANANRGLLGTTRLLQDASYEELWRPQARVRDDRKIGLAWFLAESPYGPWAFHGGRDLGFRSHISILPDHGGGLAVISNYSDTPIRPLREALAAAAFGRN